jgi:predicted alpha/beta-hydrolase family hydrolase
MSEFIVVRPPRARAILALAHGAGAGMRHSFLEALSARLAARDLATLRYEFPYMAGKRRRIDPPEALHEAVRHAVRRAAEEGLPLYAGGKSMGGRMTSQAQAALPLPGVRGLAFIGFPLHPAKEPSTKRAEHLKEVHVPMLFLQGTRDDLADLTLLKPIIESLPSATLHIVEGADHAFHVLKRSGRTDEEVLRELAERLAFWARPLAR